MIKIINHFFHRLSGQSVSILNAPGHVGLNLCFWLWVILLTIYYYFSFYFSSFLNWQKELYFNTFFFHFKNPTGQFFKLEISNIYVDVGFWESYFEIFLDSVSLKAVIFFLLYWDLEKKSYFSKDVIKEQCDKNRFMLNYYRNRRQWVEMINNSQE